MNHQSIFRSDMDFGLCLRAGEILLALLASFF